MNRRLCLTQWGALAMAASCGWAAGQERPRRIEIIARRFEFVPHEIEVTAGAEVHLSVRSQDLLHGISLPDLNLRFDLVPDKVTSIVLRPEAPGQIVFVCDNFCGDGHEKMLGRLIVRA